MTDYKRPSRSQIEAALGSIYSRSGKTKGTMVESLAEHLDERWDALTERAEREGRTFDHVLMLVIWDWFPGGGTAEIAAQKVMAATTANGSEGATNE